MIDKVWAGGDTLRLGLATIPIGQGRRAAECIHAQLRGEEPHEPPSLPQVGLDLAICDGCKKCWEECPCGYIDAV